jgi:3-hydroxyacyl-[acyl-carrier-protein] dehydratase
LVAAKKFLPGQSEVEARTGREADGYTGGSMDPLALLPHQPPMRLLEEIVELQPGELAVARRVTHETDFYFQGHFPGDPIVPAVILVEMLAQAGGLAAGTPRAGDPAVPVALRVAGLGPFKFPSAARAGDVLEARARVVGQMGGLDEIEGEVTAGGRAVATGAVTLARVVV